MSAQAPRLDSNLRFAADEECEGVSTPLTYEQSLLASVFSLGGRSHYVHVGWFLISYANLAVIVAMIVAFALAIVLPFPGRKRRR